MSRHHLRRRRSNLVSLTEDQRATVLGASQHLPMHQREAFLRRVSLSLRMTGDKAAYPTDRAVESALASAFDEFGPHEDNT